MGTHITPNAFTHNAWVSDDGNYVFTTDEQSDCNVGAYDVSNISDIRRSLIKMNLQDITVKRFGTKGDFLIKIKNYEKNCGGVQFHRL